MVLKGHKAPVRGLLWNSELPHLLITGSWDFTIRIWDTRDGANIDTVMDHGGDVYGRIPVHCVVMYHNVIFCFVFRFDVTSGPTVRVRFQLSRFDRSHLVAHAHGADARAERVGWRALEGNHAQSW